MLSYQEQKQKVDLPPQQRKIAQEYAPSSGSIEQLQQMLHNRDLFAQSVFWQSTAIDIDAASQGVLGLIRWIQMSAKMPESFIAALFTYCKAAGSQAGGGASGLFVHQFATALESECGVHCTSSTQQHPLEALLEQIHTDQQLATVFSYVQEHVEEDPAHDIQHSLRVASWALKLANHCAPASSVIVAALLHDVVNLPKNHPQARQASKMSSEVAATLLHQISFASTEEILEICSAIEAHSYSRGLVPITQLGRALQDADRLEALGAIGLIRLFAVGVQLDAMPFEPKDPFAARRQLNDKAFSVDHLYTKIFHLADTMCTADGREEANKRTKLMRHFVACLKLELTNASSCFQAT